MEGLVQWSHKHIYYTNSSLCGFMYTLTLGRCSCGNNRGLLCRCSNQFAEYREVFAVS